MTTETTRYDADDLSALEGLDAVRKRPGMYIGSNDSTGLTHLVHELLDNSVDEAVAGHCTRIEVTFHPDGSVEVADNGRGIPVGVNAKTKLSGVELVFTKLHAGGKFGSKAYQTSGGLHGVGASVVNALSLRVDVTVHRDKARHEVSFQRGHAGVFTGKGPDAKFTKKPGIRVTGKAPARTTGTAVRFWHDPVVFLPGATVDKDAVTARAKQTAFLVPGVEISVRDATGGQISEETFRFDGGVVDMVDTLASDRAAVDPLHLTGTGTFKETVPVLDEQGHMVPTELERTVEVDVALRFGVGYDTQVASFVNVVGTHNGGTHVKGFERAVLAGFRKALDGTRIQTAAEKKKGPVILSDVLEGVTAVVAVRVPEPQFTSQTKDQLGTPGVLKVVQNVVESGIVSWAGARRTKSQATVVMKKIAEAARVRTVQQQTKEAARRKSALEGASMPAKLVDCQSTGVDRAELFIVEGDSALGTAKVARDGRFQALLPIRGKILNVQKASLSDMLKNAECSAIIQVLGAGSGRTFDLDQARYGRVVIMADADVDGAHIRCLLLTLFFRYMRPFVDAGRLYAAVPPLHKIDVVKGDPVYTYSQAELDRTLSRLEKSGTRVKQTSRFKGLGEMDADQLWETTMNPVVRAVRQVTTEDAHAAEAALELIMGSDVAPRREWIIESAPQVGRDTVDA